jgi:branched-chain amino acid transport system ATP-binding protein
VLDLVDIGVRFGGVRALDGVSLSLREGEIVGLVGPNGAGKTTLFNVISGTLRPNRGSVRIAGSNVAGTPPYVRARRGLGRTFQIPQPLHGLSVAENLIVAQRFGAGGIENQAREEILTLTGLAGKADRDAATELSLTELKALEVAKALATRPRLLLLDEVLAGLEVHAKRRFTELLAQIHVRYGVAMLIIEHDLDAIGALCPRIAVLNFGKLIADGPPEEVFNEPEVISSYIGAPADA